MKYVARELPRRLERSLADGNLPTLFAEVDDELRLLPPHRGESFSERFFSSPEDTSSFATCGSCACCALVPLRGGEEEVVVVNLGDSRAIGLGLREVGESGEEATIVFSTTPHDCFNKLEMRRVKAAGCFIENDRVMGTLRATRGFGDFAHKQSTPVVLTDPDVRRAPKTMRYLVLLSGEMNRMLRSTHNEAEIATSAAREARTEFESSNSHHQRQAFPPRGKTATSSSSSFLEAFNRILFDTVVALLKRRSPDEGEGDGEEDTMRKCAILSADLGE